MPLKESKGNMYDWVTHTHSHLAGECIHKCKYCYVQKNRFGVSERYKGEIRLIESELKVNYGAGKKIFIEHMNDLFAWNVPKEIIDSILYHCNQYPKNQYIFQTKNPKRILDHMDFINAIPKKSLIGTTIETNKFFYDIASAPRVYERFLSIKDLSKMNFSVFVTIEPIIDFDVQELSEWIRKINPLFVNIGADSKGCNLPEPSKEDIWGLINKLREYHIDIKEKRNLKRLL